MTKTRAASIMSWILGGLGLATGVVFASLLLRNGHDDNRADDTRTRHVLDSEGGGAPAAHLRGANGVRPPFAKPEPVATIDDSLHELKAAISANDAMAVQEHIAALARIVCRDPSSAEHVLNLAVQLARRGAMRYASDILHAMGRCDDSGVIALLVDALGREDLPVSLRDSLILSIAQRREPDLGHSEGPGYAKGDTHVGAPIAEDYARAALLELLDETLQNPNEHWGEAQVNCLFALGASAGNDAAVLERFQTLVTTRQDLAGMALMALRLAGKSSVTSDLALGVLDSESATEDMVTSAVGLLLQADPASGFTAVTTLLADAAVSDRRKLWLLTGMTGMPHVPDALVHDLEAAVMVAQEWAGETRSITSSHKVSMRENAPRVELHEDPRLAFSRFMLGAVVAANGRSEGVARTGASALLYYLRASPPLRGDRLTRIVGQQVLAGGQLFVDTFIAELERSDLGDKRLASALLGMRALDPESWSSIRSRVLDLAMRLPEEMRDDLVRRLE